MIVVEDNVKIEKQRWKNQCYGTKCTSIVLLLSIYFPQSFFSMSFKIVQSLVLLLALLLKVIPVLFELNAHEPFRYS